MVLAVPMSQWSWLEDIIDKDGIPTGKKVRVYGKFWNWIHSSFDASVVTPSFKRLISENPKIMMKGKTQTNPGIEWGVEIMPTTRFNVPDFRAWATSMLVEMAMAGITYLATTCTKAEIRDWYEAHGLTEPE